MVEEGCAVHLQARKVGMDKKTAGWKRRGKMTGCYVLLQNMIFAEPGKAHPASNFGISSSLSCMY
jgi:hypothetical protein